jgi:hypothetical protein
MKMPATQISSTIHFARGPPGMVKIERRWSIEGEDSTNEGGRPD